MSHCRPPHKRVLQLPCVQGWPRARGTGVGPSCWCRGALASSSLLGSHLRTPRGSALSLLQTHTGGAVLCLAVGAGSRREKGARWAPWPHQVLRATVCGVCSRWPAWLCGQSLWHVSCLPGLHLFTLTRCLGNFFIIRDLRISSCLQTATQRTNLSFC